jgi:hypothetical protein
MNTQKPSEPKVPAGIIFARSTSSKYASDMLEARTGLIEETVDLLVGTQNRKQSKRSDLRVNGVRKRAACPLHVDIADYTQR